MKAMLRRINLVTGIQAAIVAACLFGTVSAIAAPPKYRLTLVSKPEWDNDVSVIAINNAGHVMGQFEAEGSGDHTFLYKDGSTIDINPDAYYVWGTAMNDSGAIVGTTETKSARRAFSYENGVFTKLEIPELTYTDGIDINESGQILGAASHNDGRGFLYHDGAVEILPGEPFSYLKPVALNDFGAVVGDAYVTDGYEPFIYQDGEITGLGRLGRETSRTVGINNAGRVIGDVIGADSEEHVYSERAFIRFPNGNMIDLGTFGGEPWHRSHSVDINKAGHVVGSTDGVLGYHRAFLYKSGVMTKLGMLGRAMSGAFDITDNGQIVGIANDDYTYATFTVFIHGIDGTRTRDLNDLVDGADPLKPHVLLKSVPARNAINEFGQIVAMGIDSRDNSQRIYLASPIDQTPPVVKADVNGSIGSNGWYTSDVTIAWAITDPEAPIGAKVGCVAATVQADTLGIVRKCQAKSMGGASPIRRVRVKRDTVKPSARVVTPQANAVYNRNQVVSADYQCSDVTSGIQSCMGPVASGGFIDTSQAVTNAKFRVVAIDHAGHKRIVTRTYSVH